MLEIHAENLSIIILIGLRDILVQNIKVIKSLVIFHLEYLLTKFHENCITG